MLTVGGLLGVSSAWQTIADWHETATLAKALRGADSLSRHNAVALLMQRGPEVSVPILLEATHDTRGEVRLLAFQSLARSWTRPATLIPSWIAAAGDDQVDIRAEAARGLASVQTRWSYRASQPSDEKARGSCLDALRRLLDDPSPLVRAEAVTALAVFGPDPATTANLSQATRDLDRTVRFAGARALLKINGPADRQAGQTLVTLVADPTPIPDRREIMDALMNTTGDSPKNGVLALATLLSKRDPFVVPDVIDCLTAVSDRASAAVPALESLWSDPHYELRVQAGMAIVAIDGRPSPHVDILVDIISDATLQLGEREAAVPGLQEAGPRALTKATPELLRQLTDQNAQVRLDAAQLLGSIIDQAPATLPAMKPPGLH